jgi:hypothetical protein
MSKEKIEAEETTVDEVLAWLNKQVTIWTEKEYAYSDWHWKKRAADAGEKANMYGLVYRKLSDAWKNCTTYRRNMFELRKAVNAVIPLIANGDIGVCGDPSNIPACDFEQFRKDMDAAWAALTNLEKAAQAKPRNCDAYPPEKLQKQFLAERWLLDSEDGADPIGNWTKEMLIAYSEWLLEPCKSEEKANG